MGTELTGKSDVLKFVSRVLTNNRLDSVGAQKVVWKGDVLSVDDHTFPKKNSHQT
jgi:hypothetical protein